MPAARRSIWPLLALSALPPVVEVAILAGVGFEPARGLAPQASAIPPYGSFHDLRWLLVYHFSWWSLAVECVGAVVLRTLLTAALARAAWPAGHDRPPLAVSLRRALTASLVALALLSPWAAVAVAAAETSLSWFVFGEVLPLLFLGAAMQRAGVVGGWWHGLPAPGLVGWTLTAFVAYSVEAMVIGFVPGWWVVAVVGVFGTANAFLWRALVRSAVVARVRWRRLPTTPVAIAVCGLALLLMGRLAVAWTAAASQPPPAIGYHPHGRRALAGLYVGGFDSSYGERRPGARQELADRFSYRGVDRLGRPLPYRPATTHQSLLRSARLLASQVVAVHRRTGRRVALVGQSEGTLVIRTYLELLPHHDVAAAVLLSPLVRPGRIYYPPSSAASGWGIGVGWELRGMLGLVRAVGGPDVSADEPFVRSVLTLAPMLRNRMLCPVEGVRMLALIPTVSAAVTPPGAVSAITAREVSGLHGDLLGRVGVQRVLRRFLSGRPVRPYHETYFALIQKAAGAWQAPALALALNPVWHAQRAPDVSLGGAGCSYRSPPASARRAAAGVTPRAG